MIRSCISRSSFPLDNLIHPYLDDVSAISRESALMGRLVSLKVVSVEVGAGGRTIISFILRDINETFEKGVEKKLTFVGTLLSRSCSRKGAISAEHNGHLRD
jgi:hypothetical protein